MNGARKRPDWMHLAGMVLALGLWAAQAFAAPPSAEEVERLMELSGLNRQIPRIPAAIELGFDRQQGKLKPGQAKIVRQEMAASYQARKMTDIVRSMLRGSWKKEAMDAEREWLTSPLGSQLTAMEIEGDSVEAVGKLEAFAVGLNQTPPAPERVDVIAHVIHAAGLDESTMDDMMAIMTAAMIGVNSGQKPEKQLTLDQIGGIIREARKNFAEPLRNQLLLRNLYTYRKASQSDLESYAYFLESPGAKYFNGLVAKGMREAIQAANADFANRLQALADKLAETGA